MIWVWAGSFISLQGTKRQCFFYPETHIYKGQKRLCHKWSYHLKFRSQWPWFKARHIVFLRYTSAKFHDSKTSSFLITSRTGFFHIWPDHLTRRSQWPDFKLKHTVFPRCTNWQSLMTLSMKVFKLWSGHEVDRRTDRQTDGETDGHAHHTIIRPVIDGRITTKTIFPVVFQHQSSISRCKTFEFFKIF
jgi:hypothetical protein